MRLRKKKGQSEGGAALSIAPGLSLDVSVRGGSVRVERNALEVFSRFAAEGSGEGVEVELRHAFATPTHLYVPHLAPEDGFVIGDFVFRSPAILIADDRFAVALIPDLTDVGRLRNVKAHLDYDHPARTVRFGAADYRWEGHVFFVKQPVGYQGQTVSLRLHVVWSDKAADLANPYKMAARWMWRRWGRRLHAKGGSQRAPLSTYMHYVTRWAFSREGWGSEVWQSFRLGGEEVGAPVFIVDVTRHPSVPVEERRWREPRAVWNQAWFSTQRCANGLLRHARQTGSAELEHRACAMTRLALAAPQTNGLFPSVVTPEDPSKGWDRVLWKNSDRRPGSVSQDAVHLVDASFTSRLLLEWHQLAQEPTAVEYVRRYARRLVALRRPSGAFPAWVEPDGAVAAELSESPETAMSVSLLFDLLSLGIEEEGWRAAALTGAAFVESVIGEARWEDFETYWSCAPWGRERLGEKVPRNGVFKQNTLSIAWCAEAMLGAWRATNDRRYLALARRCVDELSLYQAVWDPPFLPAPAHGGFGVMNADSEWNDARQSLFAPLYLDMYRATGDVELFERGAAALRASFSMLYCPENEALAPAYERRFPVFGAESYGFMMENQGHGDGGEPIGTFTIFSWGNGSALAAAATLRDRYGELYLDKERGRLLPVEGVFVTTKDGTAKVEDPYGRESLAVVDSTGRRRTLKLRGGRGSIRL